MLIAFPCGGTSAPQFLVQESHGAIQRCRIGRSVFMFQVIRKQKSFFLENVQTLEQHRFIFIAFAISANPLSIGRQGRSVQDGIEVVLQIDQEMVSGAIKG
jgi:hypothetical protein